MHTLAAEATGFFLVAGKLAVRVVVCEEVEREVAEIVRWDNRSDMFGRWRLFVHTHRRRGPSLISVSRL